MISINKHSSIQIDDLFFDPYLITDKAKKARFIFITHPHYDHLSTEDIDKVVADETIFVAPKDAEKTLNEFYPQHKKFYVLPNETLSFDDFKVETYPAYNTNKQFHQKSFGWLGYKIIKGGVSYYVAGDTDITTELEAVTCDVLFVPIGGTYTMTAKEASLVVNKIAPKVAVPTHYGAIVGSKEDAKIFKENVNSEIEVKILIK